MFEVWKNIKGFEKYQISNYGNVKSFCHNREKILKHKIGKFGYHRVTLYGNKKMHYKLVSRLVGFAFIENNNNYPDINHIDGNKSNNRIDNLEWCTKQYNSLHYAKYFRKKRIGQDHNRAKLNNEKVLEIRSLKNILSGREISKKFGVTPSTISIIINNKNWTHV